MALSTRRLNAVTDHRHADLTATVQAGATLAEVNRELGTHDQWIALDPGWSDRATSGRTRTRPWAGSIKEKSDGL